MEVQYKTHKLNTEFAITELVNVSYYTLSKDFLWSGESHEPWEMVYVDKGEMVITAGTDTYLLKSGEAAFHCPHEFHNLRTSGQKAANVIVMIMDLEDKYGIMVEDDQIMKLKTVGDVVADIEAHQ